MMDKFCYSCGAPLSMPEFKGPSDVYCKYCTTKEGELMPREVVQKGVAQWLQSWQPDLDDAKAIERADYYLKAMPAWAE
jgi:uncharacterized Zn finger protein (UPF0148 family)